MLTLWSIKRELRDQVAFYCVVITTSIIHSKNSVYEHRYVTTKMYHIIMHFKGVYGLYLCLFVISIHRPNSGWECNFNLLRTCSLCLTILVGYFTMLNRTGKYFSKRALLLSRQQHPSSGQLTRLNTTDARGFNFLAGDAKASTKEGLTFSTGIIGHLSESSVICRQGGSVLHAVVNSARTSDATDAFLPLTVDYRARQYAFGVIPTTSSRRERHGGDDEILVARCIDRAVRPLFPKGYVNEVQLLVTAHAADGVHDPTIAAVNAASFALLKSKQPWYGPIGCVRVGMIDGLLKVDPTLAEMETSTLDLVYAGTAGRALM